MKADPLCLALRHIVETKRLLESLLTSSESFDYPRAKAALEQLQAKTKALGKAQADLETMVLSKAPNVRVIDFTATASGQKAPDRKGNSARDGDDARR